MAERRNRSSGRYLYAIIAVEDVPSEGFSGVQQADLEYVTSGPLAAVTSRMDLDLDSNLRADLTAHTEVLEWLRERATVIPVAFGTVLEDVEAAVTDVLDSGVEESLDVLGRLADTAQFNLRGVYRRDEVLSELVLGEPRLADLYRRTRGLPPEEPHPELLELGQGLADAWGRARTADGERILAAVAPYVLDIRELATTDEDQVFNAAVLVSQSHQEVVESTLEEIAASEHARIRLQLTGPYPAYDFVDAGAWAS